MRLIALLLTTIFISGCGWQLRGATPLPAEYRVLYLQSNAGPSFDRQLTLQLEFNGVILTDKMDDAPAALIIEKLIVERNVLSVRSSGQIAEYELNGLLTARLLRIADHDEVLIDLNARRYLTNDIDNVLGTENSERLQRMELEKDLANKLLRRLQYLGNTPAKTPTPEASE